jgi:hypothetical protein
LKIIIPQDGGQAPATISIDNWAALLNNVPFLTMWSLEIPGYEKFRFSNLPGNGADVATGSIGSDLFSEPSKPKPIAKDMPTYQQNEAGAASRRLNSLGLMKNRTNRTFHRLLSRSVWLNSSLRHLTGKARLHLTKHPNAMPTSERCSGQPREILFSCHVGFR